MTSKVTFYPLQYNIIPLHMILSNIHQYVQGSRPMFPGIEARVHQAIAE